MLFSFYTGGILMTQGNRINKVRKSLNLTLEKFGQNLGVTKTAISRLEKGERGCTEQMIKLICNEYNVNEEWLRNGTGEMFNVPEDEIASILSEIIENPESEFYQMVLQLAHTYAALSPESQQVIDEYTKKLLKNLEKQQ